MGVEEEVRGGSGRSDGEEPGVNMINTLYEILKELITIFKNKFKANLNDNTKFISKQHSKM